MNTAGQFHTLLSSAPVVVIEYGYRAYQILTGLFFDMSAILQCMFVFRSLPC